MAVNFVLFMHFTVYGPLFRRSLIISHSHMLVVARKSCQDHTKIFGFVMKGTSDITSVFAIASFTTSFLDILYFYIVIVQVTLSYCHKKTFDSYSLCEEGLKVSEG